MDSICRTCLRSPERLLSLKEDAHLPYKIKTISSVEILLNDNLPINVCAECIVNINLSYNFRKLIVNSDLLLRKHYTLLNKKRSKNTCQITNSENVTVENSNTKNRVTTNIPPADENNIKNDSVPEESHTNCNKDNEQQTTQSGSANAGSNHNIRTITRRTVRYYRLKTKSKLYKCSTCDYTHADYVKFKQHRRLHVGVKGVCNICGKLISADNLRKHITLHTEQPVACKTCGKVCKNTESLRGHALIHRGIELKCKFCGKVYKYRSGYALHLKTHTQGNVKTVKCPLCGKLFRGNTDLKKHMRSHTGERPYPCEFCNKGFSSSHALKTHRRQHTNERPYACTLCPMAFPQKVSLRTHIKSKHPAENTSTE